MALGGAQPQSSLLFNLLSPHLLLRSALSRLKLPLSYFCPNPRDMRTYSPDCWTYGFLNMLFSHFLTTGGVRTSSSRDSACTVSSLSASRRAGNHIRASLSVSSLAFSGICFSAHAVKLWFGRQHLFDNMSSKQF